jgi:tRNA(adenine34) deaminase
VIDLCNDRRLNHRIEVNGGLLDEECGRLLRDFFAARRG